MFSIFRRSNFSLKKAKRSLTRSAAEKQTSGEVRVFVESRCKFVDPLDRARGDFSV
jgi:hypothetical protein